MPMTYSLGQAAKATGKSKMTIQRAIQKNVISAIRNDNGSYTIEPSELHRVFKPLPVLKPQEPPPDPALLKQEVEFLREKLAEWNKRDADKDAVIADLRRRLDQEGEERRKSQVQLTALLTDQRKPPRLSWWGWW
jgi:molecular chaperone GrpE (heat shock protein)